MELLRRGGVSQGAKQRRDGIKPCKLRGGELKRNKSKGSAGRGGKNSGGQRGGGGNEN